jgi:hypothetical protein
LESIGIDVRLKALLPIVDELKALRAYLEDAGRGRSDGVTFDPEIKAIDQALSRIEPHLNARKWPPVWWRLSGMNIDAVPRFFHRVDSEGAYFDRARPSIEGAYIPEREKILQVADRINGMYKALQGVK